VFYKKRRDKNNEMSKRNICKRKERKRKTEEELIRFG